MTYKRTEKAAEKGLKNDWDLIDAIAADAVEAGDPIVSAASVTEAARACAGAGLERALSTVKTYCVVAKFDHEATARQRAVFRRYGIRTLSVCAKGGVSQEVAASFLSGSHKSIREIMAEYSTVDASGSARTLSKSADPEDWEDDQWEAFDASVIAATRTILTAFNLRQRGEYEPSVEATAQLVLIRDSDWDRGLAELDA